MGQNLSRSEDSTELAKRADPFKKAHPWFRGIDWHNIHRYPAPYCPELRSPDDTRHFDSDIPPEVRSQRFCTVRSIAKRDVSATGTRERRSR
jgi:hypothetical protein